MDKHACKQDAVERIQIGKKAYGYILSTACSIAPHVSPENILVLYEAAMEEGQYRETLS
jgi:uroporphyrinogen-III decarboxylase